MRYLLWAGLALGVVLIAWYATSATSYKHCAADQAKQYTEQNSPDFFEQSHTVIVCEGMTLGENHDLLFGGLMVALTFVLAINGWRADQHFRVVERAYVKIVHQKPGVEWFGSDPGKFLMRIKIRNFGRASD